MPNSTEIYCNTMPEDRKFGYYTLLYVRCGDEILLGFKRRGFCSGLFHGYGGKMDNMETKEQCIVREMFEESKLSIQEDELKLLGFTIHSEPTHIPRVVFVFVLETQSKPEATQTEEMTPQWFHIDKIPYDNMLPDNRFYLPLVLENKLFKASFTLDPNKNVYDTNIISFRCVEDIISEFQLNYTC